MKIGLIGLGKMGANLAMNFKDHQHEVIGYDLSEAACESIAEKGIQVAKDMDDLIAKLDKPRVLWLMLPCGGPTDSTIDALSEKLAADDIVIDGGNSRYTDSMQHAKICANKQIRFLDCGTSGGVSGARNGACLMVGGDKSAFDVVKDALADVVVDQGMTYTGKAGGLDTAFCATFSTNTVKKPRIDILCEYDALDLGEAIKEGSKIVHACGHNIIATTGVGTGIAMKHILEKYNLPGEIRVVGTPAEEGGGGKIIMQKAGVFDDTDAMILLHPTSGKSKIAGRCKTSIGYDVSYHGVSAHAGNHRHKGINAHDAAVICYTSVGLLRYQTTDDVQLFVRFTDVGKESGVIPSIAKLQVQVKSFNPNSVQMMAPKVKNCIESGALATGCKVDIKEKIGYLG